MKNYTVLAVMVGFPLGLLRAETSFNSNVPTNAMVSIDTKEEAPIYHLAFGKVTIGGKEVDTAIQWNTKTGEARMLNAASFSDKSTGREGNLVGWVPLVDLQQAVQKISAEIQTKQSK